MNDKTIIMILIFVFIGFLLGVLLTVILYWIKEWKKLKVQSSVIASESAFRLLGVYMVRCLSAYENIRDGRINEAKGILLDLVSGFIASSSYHDTYSSIFLSSHKNDDTLRDAIENQKRRNDEFNLKLIEEMEEMEGISDYVKKQRKNKSEPKDTPNGPQP